VPCHSPHYQPTSSSATHRSARRPGALGASQRRRSLRPVRTGISWGTGMLEMRVPPILSDLDVCMPLKEILMIRRAVTFVLLTCLGGLSPGVLAVANESAGRYSVYPRVVATVLTLAPRGMATIQTSDGARYEVVRGTGWQVGDTVTCEHRATGRPSWQALECRKTS